MKVKLGQETFNIRFTYDDIIDPHIAIDPVTDRYVVREDLRGRDTYCIIEKVYVNDQGKVYGADQVALGAALLSKHDPYHKPMGRLIAFKDAMSKIHNQDFRRALWTAFRTTHKMPGKNGTHSHVHAG